MAADSCRGSHHGAAVPGVPAMAAAERAARAGGGADDGGDKTGAGPARRLLAARRSGERDGGGKSLCEFIGFGTKKSLWLKFASLKGAATGEVLFLGCKTIL